MTTPHVFLTRFNIPSNKVEARIYSDDWLVERVAFFDQLTVPSVRGQAADGRHWLIYLGDQSPDWLRARIDELEDEGLARGIYIDHALGHNEVRDDIRALLGRSAGIVTTSNLDNDDGLATDYLTRLRQVPITERRAVYFTKGLVKYGEDVFVLRFADNPFGAVADDLASDDFEFCWSEWHNRLRTRMPVTEIGGAAAWLQLIHSRNVSNRVRGRLIDPQGAPATLDHLLGSLPSPPRSRIWEDGLIRRPFRAIRDGTRTRAAKMARRALGESGVDEVKYRLRRVRSRG